MSPAIRLQRLHSCLDSACPIQASGKVTKVIGLVIEARGPASKLGTVCDISTRADNKKITAEVLGFGENKVLVGNFEIIDFLKICESFDLINRANNLVLEAIILTTRVKLAKINGYKKIYDKMIKKINYLKEEVERFSQNKDALDTFMFVVKYIEDNLKW